MKSTNRGLLAALYGGACLLALACASAGVAAQGQPAAPTPPTRQEIEGTVGRPPRQAPGAVTVEGGLERPPCALDDPQYHSIRFTVAGAEFADLQGLPPAALRESYAEFVGTEQPLSVICRMRDRASAILREAGYIAAVEVPAQRIEDGVVRFRVLMARLVGLRVRGDAGRNERLVARYLEPLTRQPVFSAREAERALLLAGDLPGMNVRLSLRPAGTVPGEVVGDVAVARLGGQLDHVVQNYGSEAAGRGGHLLRGQLFGLTGLGDRTVLGFYTTADFEEQQTVQLAHDFRLGGQGLQLGGQITYAWAQPFTGSPRLDLESRTLFATLEASYPFIRTRRHSVRGGIGFDIVDQEVDFGGLPLSVDRLRILWGRIGFEAEAPRRLRGAGGEAAPRWRADGAVELRQGIGGLGASRGCGRALAACAAPGTIPPSRLEGEPDAAVARAEARGEWRPVPGLTVFLGAAVQYADDPLFAFEEFSAGNYTIGRGYDPATIVGDRGAGLQAELRFGEIAPQNADDLELQPYLFFDAAWVRNRDRLFVGGGAQDLQSVGAGLRGAYGDRVQVDVTFAVPLARAGFQTETPDPRLLISLTTRLLPWRLQ